MIDPIRTKDLLIYLKIKTIKKIFIQKSKYLVKHFSMLLKINPNIFSLLINIYYYHLSSKTKTTNFLINHHQM